MEISGDVLRFLSSCLLGAGLGFLYDGFRLLRLFWKNRAAVFVEDLFFSGICTLLTLWFLVEQCSGRVRAYALFGELLGFLVYHFTVGELVIRLLRGMKAKKSKVNRIVNVAIAAMICYVAVSLLVLQADISSYRRRLSDLEAQCEEQQVQNDEMESLLKKGSDFDYIVKMAREKLGLIFSDEQVFYDAAGNQ